MSDIEREVNRKNSKLWSRFNENSREVANRAAWVNENGGYFYRNGRHYVWKSPTTFKSGANKKPAAEKKSPEIVVIVQNIFDGSLIYVTKKTKFCEEHGINRHRFDEFIAGKMTAISIFKKPGSLYASEHYRRAKAYKKWIKEHPEDAKRTFETRLEFENGDSKGNFMELSDT